MQLPPDSPASDASERESRQPVGAVEVHGGAVDARSGAVVYDVEVHSGGGQGGASWVRAPARIIPADPPAAATESGRVSMWFTLQIMLAVARQFRDVSNLSPSARPSACHHAFLLTPPPRPALFPSRTAVLEALLRLRGAEAPAAGGMELAERQDGPAASTLSGEHPFYPPPIMLVAAERSGCEPHPSLANLRRDIAPGRSRRSTSTAPATRSSRSGRPGWSSGSTASSGWCGGERVA